MLKRDGWEEKPKEEFIRIEKSDRAGNVWSRMAPSSCVNQVYSLAPMLSVRLSSPPNIPRPAALLPPPPVFGVSCLGGRVGVWRGVVMLLLVFLFQSRTQEYPFS